GTQTVKLETAFVKLKGSQAPGVNDGATVTRVTLSARDGIILMRKPPARLPKAPTSITTG
ncbi:MAG TPA: hypothetical protein VN730_05250, partial [Steroidobacteraceae bacterium]|nr:hypothetical protein [Steroidobacteraceae bacterium]